MSYQELRLQQSQTRQSLKELRQIIQFEQEALQDIEAQMSQHAPRRSFRPSMRCRMAELLQKKSWKRRKEWSRIDVQKRPEFAGDNAVSLNVLFHHLCKEEKLIRVRKGHYRCA